jgi:hypothetical protein
MPEFLTGHHEVDRMGSQPLPSLWYSQSGDAEFGESAP